MRRSNSSIDLEDTELAGQIVRHDPSIHETPHHLHEGAEAPARTLGAGPGFCLTTDALTSCEVEAMVELMTVGLAELVNARDGTYRLVLDL